MRKGKLRLDTKDGALRSKDPVVVPGKVDESELYRRISCTDEKERMPPANANRKLTAAQIDTLKRWIAEGAVWSTHWAYVPPRRPELPALKDRKWVRNEIDAFVLARLEKEGLSPSPEAAREILLRRVTLDLTGLPPTLAEIDTFLADMSATAYETVVDRLLASPRYGERMAWEWLDAARYADTNGYQGDPERTMWPWRDWVVRALNDNMPYDQFTVEQIAGDLLPNATLNQKIATGFNRNHMHNGEGGRISEETRVENVMDRVETTATVWLGSTIGCARCHDHKFDPFTQREYYQLYTYFNNTSEDGGIRGGQNPPVLEVLSEAQKAERERLREQVKASAAEVFADEKEWFLEPDGKASHGANWPGQTPKKIVDILKIVPEQRNSNQLKELLGQFEKEKPEYSKMLSKLKKAVEERDRFNTGLARVMVMDELPKPRETNILRAALMTRKRTK